MAYQPKSYRKFLAGSVSAAVVASALVAPAASAASADFPDVPKGHWAYDAISTLTAKDIINGYADGSFKPSQLLNRGQAAALFTNALGLEVPEKLDTFKDLKSTSYFAQYAAAVEAAGVFGGYADGNFGAGDNLTREQMASVLVRAFDFKATGDSVDLIDLDKAHASHRENIKILAQNGISVNEDKTFDPKDPVSRAHFATFLYRSMVATGMLAENPAVESVKAINATTVEVDFAGDIEDVDAMDFAIEGLKVENAVVKQTDASVVVLTTATQEGAKKYTVTAGGEKLGSFEGVSAVVPEDVTVTTKSQQGVVGKEVTLVAKADVKKGESAAGIPVTFNIKNSDKDNDTVEVEVFTDENGVAEYSYTRYYAGEDSVVAYSTSKSSINDNAKVYWANAAQLTVKDITEGSTLVNGTNKVYEINSAKNAGKYVFVTFKENLDVAPDKLTKSVSPQGVTTYVLDADGDVTGTTANYPYETTTGGKAVTAVKLDSKGKANLVISGSDASVTPVVFEGEVLTGHNGDQPTEFNAEYSATALQAEASTVKFELKHQLGLTLEAQGVQNAATYLNGTETGGRDYKLTYVDKDGKAVAAGTKVKVAIDNTGIQGSFLLLDANGDAIAPGATVNGKTYFEVTVGKDGQSTFTVTSTRANDYVTPVVFIDNGKATGAGVLDENDLQATAEITYFVESVTYTAELVALGSDGKAAKPVLANNSDYIEFVYELVDQNGKTRRASSTTDVTFNVTAGAGTLVVAGTDLAPGQSRPVTATIPVNGTETSIIVKAKDASNAYVTATGSRAGVVLPSTNPSSVSATFLSTTELVDGVTYAGALVTSVDKDNNKVTLRINNKNHTVEYGNGNLYISGASKTIVDFEAALAVGKLVTFVPGTTPYFDITGNSNVGVSGEVKFTADSYNDTTGQVATIELADADLDTNPSPDSAEVTVTDGVTSAVVTLTETGNTTGVFRANVDLTVFADGEITVNYDDAKNILGDKASDSYTVILDATNPTVSSVKVNNAAVTDGGDALLNTTNVFEIAATDENPYSLELDITDSTSGTPKKVQFTVYADESNTYGSDTAKQAFDAAGATAVYNASSKTWTVSIPKAALDAQSLVGPYKFEFVVKDAADNVSGAMGSDAFTVNLKSL